jgi:hypothetical protein
MLEGGFFLRLWRIALYVAVTLTIAPIQAVLLAFKAPLSRRFPSIYHRLCLRIMGFHVDVVGEP